MSSGNRNSTRYQTQSDFILDERIGRDLLQLGLPPGPIEIHLSPPGKSRQQLTSHFQDRVALRVKGNFRCAENPKALFLLNEDNGLQILSFPFLA